MCSDEMMFYAKAKYELIPSESGKTYLVKEQFTVYSTRYKKYITVEYNFEHDRYSVVPDLPDETPAIVHDKLYKTHRFDDGSICRKYMADRILKDLMKESGGKTARYAWLYYNGVCIFGIFSWGLCDL